MGLFGGNEYQNVESATAPPLATATAVPIGKVTAENTQSGISTMGMALGRHPTSIGTCPYCNQSCITRIKTYPSWETWLAAGLLFLVFWPVCWVPLVMDSCKKTDHVCSHCEAMVGQVAPMSDCCVKREG